MPIKVLEKSVCELIAAGEVVERPASVVKELVENAVDAGATSVEVELRRNGLDLIRVTDNGCGIPRGEVATAFLRHATSKIRVADDLDGIHTLGFRGEALAAICAVARVRLVTKTTGDDNATDYRIEGGAEVGCGETGAPNGTTISVSDLFYNTPARMKFLKKDVHEGNAVASIVGQLALSHPEVAFRLIRDGRTALSTPGRGDLRSAAFCVLPREIASTLIEIEPTDPRVRVSGLVSEPRLARPSRSLQYTFVNNRFVKSRGICAAAEEACKNLVMAGKHPAFVLNVELPCEDVDINVHPAKTEVRFRNEREVTSAVYAAVKLALHDAASREVVPKAVAVPQLFENEKTGDRFQTLSAAAFRQQILGDEPMTESQTAEAQNEKPNFSPHAKGQQTDVGSTDAASWTGAEREANSRKAEGIGLQSAPAANPFRRRESAQLDIEVTPPIEAKKADASRRGAADASPVPVNPIIGYMPEEPVPSLPAFQGLPLCQTTENYQTDFEPAAELCEIAESAVHAESAAREAATPLRFVGEVLDTYIIAQVGEDVLLIDKHAAHERILFERISAQNGGVCERQTLLEPVIVSVSIEERQAVVEHAETLEKIGFVAEEFGDGELAVREIPTYLGMGAVRDAVTEIARRLAEGSHDMTTESREWLLHSCACRAAIKAGHKSSTEELVALANDILTSKIPKYCPHGRPVYITLTKKEIEKQFGRA